jgi:hypothetical protein
LLNFQIDRKAQSENNFKLSVDNLQIRAYITNISNGHRAHRKETKMPGMSQFSILDPEWEDGQPLFVTAQNPLSAIKKFYRSTLLEQPPKGLYVDKRRRVGTASFASIGDVRIERFIITSESGKQFSVYW